MILFNATSLSLGLKSPEIERTAQTTHHESSRKQEVRLLLTFRKMHRLSQRCSRRMKTRITPSIKPGVRS